VLVIEGRNVNDLFAKGVYYLKEWGARSPSRAGDVVVLDSPVMSVYHKPCERVLFDPTRDANPFFHLFESIWMLAGRSDAEFLNRFVKDFGARCAEEDDILWGAYGHRWRRHFEIDQINVCVSQLRANPKERRVVIAMWDPHMDLGVSKKDLPCNTHIYLRVVRDKLDMMINCRSNDILWGAYGANAVHFSVLQEVMAAGIGVPVGLLYQNSWNWHAYTPVLDKQNPRGTDPYEEALVRPSPMVDHYDTFFQECESFCRGDVEITYRNEWFRHTAFPMLSVHKTYKVDGAAAAFQMAPIIHAQDWRLAAIQWLERRIR